MNPHASGLAAMSVVSDGRPAFERLRSLIPVEDLTPNHPDDSDDDLHPNFGRDSLQQLARAPGARSVHSSLCEAGRICRVFEAHQRFTHRLR